MTGQGEKNGLATIAPSDQAPPNSPPAQNSPNDRKRRLTSSVWSSFKKVKIDGNDVAICNSCNQRLKAPGKYGTKHLHVHLERCVKRKNMDIKQQILKANERRADGKVEYRNFVFDQETARKELASMIVLHEYPLNIVNHICFKRFVNSLQPMFKVVSRNTIRSDILKIYDCEKVKTYKLLEKHENRVAITTDMWTSNQTKKGFMAITTHFIDDTWILQSRILRFVYVPAPHNKETLSEVLVESLLDWNIDRKLSTITVDNCTTNDAMIDILLEKLDTNSLLLGGRVFHMRCCAHILNLIVKDGLEVIGEGIERIRDSVLYWIATPGRIEKFEEVARKLHIPCSKKMSLDCKTRWNSTYLMLQSAIIYKDVFPRVKQRERYYTRLPTEEDWNLAQKICDRLKLFFTVTELFSGTQYPTSNCYFPKVCEVRLALTQWLESPDALISKMAAKMMGKFKKYWDICHTVMGVAVVLDPRYKTKLVEYYFPIIYGDEAVSEIEKVRQNCYDLLGEYQSKFKVSEAGNVGASSLSHSTNRASEEQDPLAKFDLYVNNTSSNLRLKSEMDFYLEENVLPRASDFDVLSWWKTNGVKFPNLQKIARDILSIPISTVASESAFSTSGRLVSPNRSRLHPSTLEALMCSQSWLWSDMRDNKFYNFH